MNTQFKFNNPMKNWYRLRVFLSLAFSFVLMFSCFNYISPIKTDITVPSSFAVDNIAPLAIISGTVSSDTNFSKLVNGITNNDAEWNVTGESGTTIVFDWTNIYTNAIFIFFDNLTGCCLTTNLSLSLSSNGMNNYNASITAKQSIISNPIPNNIGFNRVVFTLPPADTANAGRLSLREIRIYADRK